MYGIYGTKIWLRHFVLAFPNFYKGGPETAKFGLDFSAFKLETPLEIDSCLKFDLLNVNHDQRLRYTRARQVKWPGWKIHCPNSSPGSAPLSPAYCFASVIVRTENINVTISDRFICFILSVKRRLAACVLRATTKKDRQLFWGKKCIRMTWLEDFLTSKWPGSFTALAQLVTTAASAHWKLTWLRRDFADVIDGYTCKANLTARCTVCRERVQHEKSTRRPCLPFIGWHCYLILMNSN